MTQYHFSIENPQHQYIQVKASIDVRDEITMLQFPSWRPGRYELGNFAKNVRSFHVFDASGKKIAFHKTAKDIWECATKGIHEIIVYYSYYAHELNSGSSFLNEEMLYVNPVNCCVFVVGREDEPCELKVAVPEKWIYAGALHHENNVLSAKSFHELADSPFIFAQTISHAVYEVKNIQFHVWMHGVVRPNWNKLIPDFKAFTQLQMENFGEFPAKEYHFLIHVSPARAYHGVEHQASTVIHIGPSVDLYSEVYDDLLGVCSHELYHAWNVKSIRPIEMFPYDYTRENYSSLGYLCEGVTTYMGDFYLFQSKVYSEQQYLHELEKLLHKHFDNFGRFNYSVAESSFDTWLDGYESGAPGRKVSIYTEGALIALMTDVFIMKHTHNKRCLHDVMKGLYYNYYLKNKGVSEEDYQKEIENIAGTSFEEIEKNFIHGTTSFETALVDALLYLGLKLEMKPAHSISHAEWGMKATKNHQELWEIKSIYPGSTVDVVGLMVGDKIIALNNVFLEGDLDKWIAHFAEETIHLTIVRSGKLIEKTLPQLNKNFYLTYSLSKIENPSAEQKRAFEKWSGNA
jgi:predicted metalloprotease with PDZ domain